MRTRQTNAHLVVIDFSPPLVAAAASDVLTRSPPPVAIACCSPPLAVAHRRSPPLTAARRRSPLLIVARILARSRYTTNSRGADRRDDDDKLGCLIVSICLSR